jgi:lactose/cellobiose-specific phosphotransferase system IIC component
MAIFDRVCDRLSGLDLLLEESMMLRSVRKGLMLTIPFVLIGSFALVLISLPVPAYQALLSTLGGARWTGISVAAINASFGLLSPLMAAAVSYNHVQESNESGRLFVNPLIAALVSVVCLGSLSGVGTPDFSIAAFGVTGLFAAIVVALLSCRLFLALSRLRRLRLHTFTEGASAVLDDAVHSILPALLTVALIAGAGVLLLQWFHAGDIQHLLARPFVLLFRGLGHSLASALLFVLMTHLLWLFGIHGGMVLEPVARELFIPALATNQQLVAQHLPPAHVFTKTFLDVFVLMGGCGTTLCLLLAIFLAGRQKNVRRLAAFSLAPVLLNVNELIVLGLPIVLNPLYLIPFLGTPLLITLVAYGATAAGLVPYTTHSVAWTTPVLLGGYSATGSFAGVLLQVVCLGLGVLCYLPFVRLANRQVQVRMQRPLALIGMVIEQPAPARVGWGLLERRDDIGMAARALVADLRHDLEHGRLSLAYQPQFDQLGEIIGVEALLRWRHEVHGPIPPPVTVALAEEAQLFERLDGWILDAACRYLRGLLDQGLEDITVSVNTTASRLEGGQVFENLKAAIAAYRVPPELIKVEITEQEALNANRSTVARMNDIRALGVKLAMDDFGMGHTSIVYLKDCHFDVVKIDGSLVTGLLSNPVCSEIITSVVKLGQTLSFSVIAEYVETEAQRDRLIELGCRQFQGYLYSKALDAGQLPEFIRGWRSSLDDRPAPIEDLAGCP